MDPEALAELRSLRARAYGPDADIFTDPAASTRLEQLEAQAADAAARRASDTAVEPARPALVIADVPLSPVARRDPAAPIVDDSPVGDDAPSQATPHDGTPREDGEGTGEEPADIARPRRWRAALLVTSVLAIVVVVTAFVTSFVNQRVGYDGPTEAVLVEDPGYELPEFFGAVAVTVTGFSAFYGLRPFTTPSYYTGDIAPGDTCLQVYDETATSSRNGYNGSVTYDCGTTSFPPAASMRVGPQAPDEIKARYPIGTELQFVLEGSQIVVLRGPAPDTEAGRLP